MKKLFITLQIVAASSVTSFANDSDTLTVDTLAFTNEILEYFAFQDSVENAMNYEYGEVQLEGGVATLNVPKGFKYLNAEQSKYVLTDLWGNPPASTGGLLFPDSVGPFNTDTYVIEISYSEDGYIDDEDAEDIDYDDLLSEMKSDMKESNKQRVQMGYGTVDLLGWAAKPFYDEENKKLHWAKELRFNDESSEEVPAITLNYDIRILGRKGYLNMVAIGEMDDLDDFNKNIDNILGSLQFNDGYKYSEFDPDIDEVAAYGIGGLIAGKLLAKAGIFAVLLKFGKFIAIGVIGLFAAFKKKIFGGKAS